jgi:hypothetical protein
LARAGVGPDQRRALFNLYAYFGDEFTVECPTGSGQQMTLYEVAAHISDRLLGAFRRGEDGRRPVHGGQTLFQEDPHWRDFPLFYEYLHGDDGAGIGASHQTGWTGLVGVLPLIFNRARPEDVLAAGGGFPGPQVRPREAATTQRAKGAGT